METHPIQDRHGVATILVEAIEAAESKDFNRKKGYQVVNELLDLVNKKGYTIALIDNQEKTCH